MIVSLSLPDELVHSLDGMVAHEAYRGRSELARAAFRDFLAKNAKEQELSGRVNAVLVLGYPERLERDLSEVRHAHNDLVTSMLHAHTAKGRCATVLVGEGPADRMRRFLAELRRLRGLESLEVHLLR